MDKHTILSSTTFGRRVAEEEIEQLASYFVETDHWRRLFSGDIDVVYGAKGSGKSALYSLLLSKTSELKANAILPVAAENPRGAPAFKDLLLDPPATEREFISLWKLYFAALLHGLLVDNRIRNNYTNEIGLSLQREGLVRGSLTLSGILSSVIGYVKRALRPKELEAGIELDPITQLPVGFKGKIIFSEPASTSGDSELRSVDRLLELANLALLDSNKKAWIMLDRLDVAFADNQDLEASALRALFRVYLDLLSNSQIQLKIFLRSDIWDRITATGFREASHITRHLTVSWNRNSLLNLMVRRLLHNAEVCSAYQVGEELGRDTITNQEKFFYRVFPDQVDTGINKPNTIDWLLSRTRDGSKINAPRELIHYMNCLRDAQVNRFELGTEPLPDKNHLFARIAFKEALPEVSKVRLEQTIYAENPTLKPCLELLRGEKTSQIPATLSVIWGTSEDEAIQRAISLVEVGFFEKRGSRQAPEYWVPFLYRDALDLVQGSAE
jgi:hypothetical protein